MPTPTEQLPTDATALDAVVLLPSESFFARRIPLDPAGDAATQAELALETSAPFALAQLFYGFVVAPDGQSALVYATHRRLFSAESWDGARVVLPSFIALLGDAPNRPKLRVWREHGVVTLAGFDGGALPSVVLARKLEGPESEVELWLAEARRRLGVSEVETEEFSGPAQTAPVKDGLEFTLGAARQITARFPEAQLAAMDVRDKAVLAERRATQQRDRLLWRVLLTAVGVLALAAVLEAGMLVGRAVLERQRTAQRAVAGEVSRIQTAQTLGTRIEEMSQRRLRAFEMLAVINQVRPAGLMFTRVVTNGRDTLEVEGQSANSDHVGTYETALRALPQLGAVEFPDVRLREGVTTFQFTARFKEGVLSGVGGSGATGGLK